MTNSAEESADRDPNSAEELADREPSSADDSTDRDPNSADDSADTGLNSGDTSAETESAVTTETKGAVATETGSEAESAETEREERGWIQTFVDGCRWAVQVFEGHAGADNLKNRRR